MEQNDPASKPPAAASRIPGDRPIRTFRLEISYDGTAYHGWQRQPNGITVQEVLEDKLSRLFGGIPLRVQGSSRTDAGVHALGLVGSFRAPESPYIPDWKVKKALNRLLPDDIRIRSAQIVSDDFNARFSARAKSYVYMVNTGDINPFTNRYCWHMEDMTETAALQEAIGYLKGEHDFTTFAVEAAKYEDPVRHILDTRIVTFGPLVGMYFLGTGFLYKMVRSMAGALMFVGRGRIPPAEIKAMLEARDRLRCKDTAPAKGLFLKKVFYEGESMENDLPDRPPFWMF